jgi:hypothetical protein
MIGPEVAKRRARAPQRLAIRNLCRPTSDRWPQIDDRGDRFGRSGDTWPIAGHPNAVALDPSRAEMTVEVLYAP